MTQPCLESPLGGAWSKLGDQELHSATAVFVGVLPLLSRGGKGRRAVHAQKLLWIAAS